MCLFFNTIVADYDFFFFFSSRRRHTRSTRDWSSDVCSSDLGHDLGRDPGGIGADEAAAVDEEVTEPVGRGDREEGRADRDEHVRPEAGLPLTQLPLDPNRPAEH